MIGLFSKKIEVEDLVLRFKLKRTYASAQKIDYRDKLIHPFQNSSIFTLACTDFFASRNDGAYKQLDTQKMVHQFVYIFDDYMRYLLQHAPYKVQKWAHEYLVYYYSDLVYHPEIQKLIANEADRKSCFNDAMLQLLELAGDINYKLEQKVALRSIFYEIFYRRCVDFLRKNATYKNRPNQSWTGTEATLMANLSKETQEMVDAAAFQIDSADLMTLVSELGQTCMQLIQWFYFELCTLEEIGLRVNNSASYVKTTKWRCIQRLKKMLESKIYDHE